MKIDIYSIMWNEQVLLPYFLRHYSTFADRIFIINDHSTDATTQIAQSNPKVTLLDYPFDRGFNDADHVACFTRYYKKSSRGQADWVMCVDGDEFIYHPDMLNHLAYQRRRGYRIIRTTGYAMLSRQLPQTDAQIYDESYHGVRERRYDKPCVFDPTLDLTFTSGMHRLKSPLFPPTKGKLLLLHYRYLSRDYYRHRSTTELAKMDISDNLRNYLIAGGLKFYDNAINLCQPVI